MSRKTVSIQPRGGGNPGVSLFPFLAVLLCTMGALIMLLVVIARNVRELAEEPHRIATVVEKSDRGSSGKEIVPRSDAAATVDEAMQLTFEEARDYLNKIRLETEEAEWFTENIGKSKQLAEEKLAEARAWLAAAEKESQKIKDELRRLAQLREQWERPVSQAEPETEALKTALEERRRRQREMEAALNELQKESERNARSYAIIPYRGKGGTFRRPVYIECFEDKVVIQPEGIVLTAADFAAADRPDNPLDAALRVVRQYYTETDQIERGTEPYPLLVVRPSGVEAYTAARQAMGSWIHEFGYELIDEHWEMKYPEPSEELRLRLEKQLETSRNRLAGYLAAQRVNGMTESSRRARSRQYRVDSKGVVQPLDGPEGDVRLGAGRTGRGRHAGRFSGQGSVDNRSSETAASPTYGSHNQGDPANGTSAGQGTLFNPYSQYPPGAVNPGTIPGRNEEKVLGGRVEPVFSDGVYRPNAPARLEETPQNGGIRIVQNNPDVSLMEERSPGRGAAPLQGAASAPVDDMTLYGMTMPESLAGDRARNQTPSGQPALFGVPYAAHAGNAAQNGTDDGQAAAGESNDRQATDSGENGTGVPSPFAAGLAPSANGMPVFGLSASTNPQMNQPVPAPASGGQGKPQGKSGARSAPGMNHRPDNWALRDVQPFSAAVKRNIKIQCEGDKFVLVRQTGLMGVRVIPITDSVYASTDQLVRVLWEFMDSWGIAGEKYYWQPVLQIKVLPGGEQRFEELRWLLRSSGLIVERID